MICSGSPVRQWKLMHLWGRTEKPKLNWVGQLGQGLQYNLRAYFSRPQHSPNGPKKLMKPRIYMRYFWICLCCNVASLDCISKCLCVKTTSYRFLAAKAFLDHWDWALLFMANRNILKSFSKIFTQIFQNIYTWLFSIFSQKISLVKTDCANMVS